jgi:hypothetical protein
MGILDLARKDLDLFMSSARNFSVKITITNPSTGQSAELIGLHSKHWFKVDYESGIVVDTRNAHVSITTAELIRQYFDFYNSKNEIYIKGFIIKVADSSGIEKEYKITAQFPDETTGVIVCMLGDYVPNTTAL